MAAPGHTVAAAAGAGEDLVLAGVRKQYGSTVVLDVAHLVLRRGEVVALAGENGAGKSTMMGIVSGAVRADRGTVSVCGRVLHGGPFEAQRLGVAMVSQEFPLVGQLSVAENLLLGKRPGGKRVLVDRKALDTEARRMLRRVGLEVSTRRRVDLLAVGQRQLLEIAKALGQEPVVLILDEPTSALAEAESKRVLEIARRHAENGGIVVFVGHRMHEVLAVADRVVVLRNGRVVADMAAGEATEARMVRAMVGRELEVLHLQGAGTTAGTPAFQARALCAANLGPVDLEVRAGEVVGVAGLMGAGRSRLLHVIAGAIAATSGEMSLDGGRYSPRSTRDAVAAGVGLVPEDRKTQALLVDSPIRWNATLAVARRVAWHRLVLTPRRDRAAAAGIVAAASVRCRSPEQTARSLSGGNQQRLVFGRWMAVGPRLLLLDEPTRGVDVGAKAEIYKLIAEQRRKGMALLVASSELEELLTICDRIVVMRRGRIATTLARAEFSKERVIAAAALGAEARL